MTHRTRAAPYWRLALEAGGQQTTAPTAQHPRLALCLMLLNDGHANHARLGPARGQGTAGPGRGHVRAYSVHIECYSFDDLPRPPPGVANKTWLE